MYLISVICTKNNPTLGRYANYSIHIYRVSMVTIYNKIHHLVHIDNLSLCFNGISQ